LIINIRNENKIFEPKKKNLKLLEKFQKNPSNFDLMCEVDISPISDEISSLLNSFQSFPFQDEHEIPAFSVFISLF